MRHSKQSDSEVKRGEVFTRPFFCCLKYSLPIVTNQFGFLFPIRTMCHREMAGFCDYLSCAITFSVIAYLVTAVFNDSFLTVAPVFWCLAGVGEGLRFRKIRRKSSGATWISPLDSGEE